MDDGSPSRASRPWEAPPPHAGTRRGDQGHSLPLSRTPLIGRAHDVEVVSEFVRREDVPLVTLTGPGGVGKTRLALQVAAEVAPKFADGACFVELGGLREADLVLPAVARALGLGDKRPRTVTEQLVAHLRPRHFLLVLDNFEQVIEAAPGVADLLGACPGLTVLATSRAVLRLTGEHDVPVDPLAIPSAVHLFVARARAADPAFALTAGNAATVAAICARLDGLPLAIELAAARAAALPPAALLARLDHALPLLTGGARDRPDRLRTMRAAIAWSFDLLSPLDRVLFGRLAVFVGGFELRSAEAVCKLLSGGGERGVDGGGAAPSPFRLPPSHTMLDIVQSLVEHSLLRQVGGPAAEEPRYRMLETVREYGLECLAASGEEWAVRAAHAAYVTTIFEEAAARIADPDYERVLVRLDAEHDNARAALAWAETTGEAELGLRLAGTVTYYWVARGHYREGRAWLERALGRADPAPTPARARALVGAGWLARLHGESPVAAAFLAEAVEVARAAGDREQVALAAHGVGTVAMDRGDYAEAAGWIEQALGLFREIEADVPAGPWLVAVAYANLGQTALAQGQVERSAGLLEEALRRHRSLGTSWGLSFALRCLGDLALVRGDHERARASYRESLELARDQGDRRHQADAVAGIAALDAARGRPERAARLLGGVASVREQIGAPDGWGRPTHERGLSRARAALSPTSFARAWAAGAALPIAEVVAEALADEDAAAAPVPAPVEAERTVGSPLTAREREVLRLLADGLSDRQIAAALSISPRTVGGHVTHLLAKLELESRAAAAAFAVRHGFA